MKPPSSIHLAFCPASTTRTICLPTSKKAVATLLIRSALSQSESADLLVSAQANNAALNTNIPAVVFEPIFPSTTTLLGMTVIVILCGVVSWVWQTQVVPTSRANLAFSKSRGAVKRYLDELREAGDTGGGTIDDGFQMDLRVPSVSFPETETQPRNGPKIPKALASSRAFERWLFTEWLLDNKSAKKTRRQKEPALPVLKDAKWNSGDNPVLAASLLIGVGVFVSAVTERVATTAF